MSIATDRPAVDKGWIFDIQRYSVHDGPGIRTTIFFKGCPLSCLWCSNPESQSPKAQILYFKQLCKGCGECIKACTRQAISIADGFLHFDREKCVSCGACAEACLYGARILSGRLMSVDEICEIVSRDWRIYMQSGGGVTCGGGEALMQPGFLHSLLMKLHEELGYNTCLDTSGYVSWQVFETLLPYLDLVLLDIKHMDPHAHRELTGTDNALILNNARELGKRTFPVLIRVPLIPNENDDSANFHALGNFLRVNCLKDVELMPYHTYGLNKYDALGKEYPLSERPVPDTGSCKETLESYGLSVRIRQ